MIWGNQWLSDENIYAVFCCTGIPFAYVLWLRYDSKWKKLCYLICLSLYIIGVAQAGSRGGFLAFSVVVFMFWWISKKKIKGVMILIFFGIAILVALPQMIYEEIKQINVDEQEGESGERTYLWRLGIDMFNDHKVVGIGLGNYGEHYLAYDQMADARDRFGGINWRGHKMVAHSTPVSFLAETGIVGIALLVIFLVSLTQQFVRHRTWHRNNIVGLLGMACAIAMLAFWVGSLFLTLTVYPFFYNIAWLSSIILYLPDVGH